MGFYKKIKIKSWCTLQTYNMFYFLKKLKENQCWIKTLDFLIKESYDLKLWQTNSQIRKLVRNPKISTNTIMT